MRLLRLEVQGATLFESSTFAIDLFATDRVVNPDKLENPGSVHRLGTTGSIYSQNVVGVAGINASGKTTTLKLIRLALSLVGGPYVMRSFEGGIDSPIGRLEDEITMSSIFWHEGRFYLLESELRKDSDEGADYRLLGYAIANESLWAFAGSRIKRGNLASAAAFKEVSQIVIRRRGPSDDSATLSADQLRYLTPTTSIAVSLGVSKLEVGVPSRTLLEETLPDGVVQAFDGSIEWLKWDSESEVFHLKFKDGPERVVSRDVAKDMLSTGTIVGSEMVARAITVLANGGYLLVDEIEQSLNKSLVAMLIGLFTSPRTNPKGAQLVFTTHYTQLLDNLRRNDGVYLLTRGDDYKTRILKYSEAFERDDYRKSDVIMSNTIRGTNPKYEDVKRLNRYVADHVGGAQ